MPANDKKKDELTLDTTSPSPPAPPSGGPPPTTATTLNASAFALRASLTVYGSDPDFGGVAPSWTDVSVRLAASAILHPRVSSRPARRDSTLLAFEPLPPPDTAVRVPPSRAQPLSFLSSRRSGSACRTSTTSARTACARRGLSSRRGVPSRSSPPSTSTPARGTSFASTRARRPPTSESSGTASNPTLDPNRHRETNRRRLPRRRTPLGSTPDRRVVED